MTANRAMQAIADEGQTRTRWRRLVREILQIAGEHAELIHHAEKAWTAVTFSGARHTVRLGFTGHQAMDEADQFIAALPDHEFTIRGWLAADATIVAVEQQVFPEPKVTVEAEVLLLEDG